jgi:hypothetical protein
MALIAALASQIFSPIRYLLRVTSSLLSPPVHLLASVYYSLVFLLRQPFALTIVVEASSSINKAFMMKLLTGVCLRFRLCIYTVESPQ